MQKWIQFYEPHFPTPEEAETFVSRCESTEGSHAAKIIMHQTQRLLTLATDVAKLRPKRDGLQLLFLIICAENVSKLHDDFHGDGSSKKYVLRFFSQLVSETDKRELRRGIASLDLVALSLEQIATELYKIRCAVVHEGEYWSFSLSDDGVPTASIGSPFLARMTIDELRTIIVRGCIRAALDRLGA